MGFTQVLPRVIVFDFPAVIHNLCGTPGTARSRFNAVSIADFVVCIRQHPVFVGSGKNKNVFSQCIWRFAAIQVYKIISLAVTGIV
jgi:hypothetical protein